MAWHQLHVFTNLIDVSTYVHFNISRMDSSYFPQSTGLLAYFLLYSSIAALIHALACYVRPLSSLRPFSGPDAPQPVILLAHVYGIKNIYTSLIRFYAAYNIEDPVLYTLAIWTYVGVFVLYVGELVLWRTVRLREGIIPILTAGLGIIWMLWQKNSYTGPQIS